MLDYSTNEKGGVDTTGKSPPPRYIENEVGFNRERYETSCWDRRSKPIPPKPVIVGACPTCGELVYSNKSICLHCYQRLDWSKMKGGLY